MSSSTIRPPGRRAARISATAAAGSRRWVSRKRAYTTSYSASPSPPARSRDPELDVRDLGLLGVAASELDLGGVEVHADDRPVIPTSEARSNVTSPPPQPTSRQRSPAVDAGPLEEGEGGGPHHPGQHAQPLPARDAAADQVVVLLHLTSASA